MVTKARATIQVQRDLSAPCALSCELSSCPPGAFPRCRGAGATMTVRCARCVGGFCAARFAATLQVLRRSRFAIAGSIAQVQAGHAQYSRVRA